MAVRVLLAESHRMIRDAFRSLLESGGEFEVVGNAQDGREAVRLWRQLKPDVGLLAIHLNHQTGIAATVEILKESPSERIVLLASEANDALLVPAARSGAKGLIAAQATAAELLTAMRAVAAGGFYLGMLPFRGATAAGRERIEALSPREQEVLQLVADGKSSKEIAALLQLGVETVRSYRKSMMKKLHVTNVARATWAAIAGGLAKAPSKAPEA